MGSGKDEVETQHNEEDGPGRCSCWVHRRRRFAVHGAPYDEYQGTDEELLAWLKKEKRRVLV